MNRSNSDRLRKRDDITSDERWRLLRCVTSRLDQRKGAALNSTTATNLRDPVRNDRGADWLWGLERFPWRRGHRTGSTRRLSCFGSTNRLLSPIYLLRWSFVIQEAWLQLSLTIARRPRHSPPTPVRRPPAIWFSQSDDEFEPFVNRVCVVLYYF